MDKQTVTSKDLRCCNYLPLEDMLNRNIAMEKMIARLDEMSTNIASGMSIADELRARGLVSSFGSLKPDSFVRVAKNQK